MTNEMIEPFERYDNYESILEQELLEDGIIRETIGVAEKEGESIGVVETVFGDPEDAKNWHLQSERNSCVIACQEFVAEQLMERDFSEKEMIEYAEKRGWYDPKKGTAKSDVGNLLEAIGLDVERKSNNSITDIMQALSDGEKVICGVNSLILAEPQFADMPGLNADHAVEFIGVDFSNPKEPRVILNDSGRTDGRAIQHNLDVFLKAWDTSDNYAVIVGKGTVR